MTTDEFIAGMLQLVGFRTEFGKTFGHGGLESRHGVRANAY
jgi:hypothetical protein